MKIALLCDSYIVPRWQYDIVEFIHENITVDITVIFQNVMVDKSSKTSGQKSLFWKLYQRADDKLYSKGFFSPNCDIRNIIDSSKVIEINSEKIGIKDIVSDCSYLNIDLAIRFGWRIIDGPILNSFRIGICSFHHGDNDINRGGPACFWEMFLKQYRVGVTLQLLNSSLDGGEIIEKGFVKTDFSSLSKNKISVFSAGNELLFKYLRRVKRNEKIECISNERICYDRPFYKAPNSKVMFNFILKTVSFIIKRKLLAIFVLDHWGISYKKNGKRKRSLSNMINVKSPSNSFIADPFFFSREGKNYIFYERYCYKMKKGVIAVYDIENKCHKDIIEEKYHLSFPCVFYDEGEIYMTPQSDNRSVDLYKCVEFPFSWEKETSLVESIENDFGDPVILKKENIYYLFATKYCSGAAFDANNKLYIYIASSLYGPYIPHNLNPIKIDCSSARQAGGFLTINDNIIRPVQDCSESYGGKIKFYRIEKLSADEYLETYVDELTPNFEENVKGIHTIYFDEEYIVIDSKISKLRWL